MTPGRTPRESLALAALALRMGWVCYRIARQHGYGRLRSARMACLETLALFDDEG